MGSNPMPSAYGSMGKWTSSLASNEVFRVRVLVELLTNGRATRLATGAGWKPVELSGLEGSTPSPSAEYGVRGVAVTARLAVNQKVGVRLPSNTP